MTDSPYPTTGHRNVGRPSGEVEDGMVWRAVAVVGSWSADGRLIATPIQFRGDHLPVIGPHPGEGEEVPVRVLSGRLVEVEVPEGWPPLSLAIDATHRTLMAMEDDPLSLMVTVSTQATARSVGPGFGPWPACYKAWA